MKTRLLNAIRGLVIFAAVLCIGFFGQIKSAAADAPFSDNFEWWTGSVPHTLVYGNAWYQTTYGGDQCTIVQSTKASNSPYEGQRMIECRSRVYVSYIWEGDNAVKNGTASNNGFWSWQTLLENAGATEGNRSFFLRFTNIDQTGMCGQIAIYRSAAGWDIYFCENDSCSSKTLIDTIVSNNWHNFAIAWDTSAYNASNRWIQYMVDGNATAKNYNPFPATCLANGIGSFQILGEEPGSNGDSWIYIDDIQTFNSSAGSSVSLTYPTNSSTSKAEYWNVAYDYTPGDPALDSVYLTVRYATTQYCAEHDCQSSFYDFKTLNPCDGETAAAMSASTNVSRSGVLQSGMTYYAQPTISGASVAICDGTYGNLETTAVGPTITFTYDSDFIGDLNNADTFWNDTWSDKWGTATSTLVYQGSKTFFDYVTGPILNIMAGWSNIFDASDATDYGVAAGAAIAIIFTRVADYSHVLPGNQILLIVFIAVIFDLGIFFFRTGYKFLKLARG